MRECTVLLNGYSCENGNGERIRTSCYRCGGVACKGCSFLIVTNFPANRRIRICRDCWSHEEETQP